MQKLILWDIDGTLLYGGGVSGEMMRTALEQTYGRLASIGPRISYAGKTDQQIILETFPDQPMDQLLGIIDQFVRNYVEAFNARRSDFLAHGRVLDGVVAALERLATHAVVQSVLTGNIEPIARLKLDAMGLARYLDLSVGAYGSDHYRRINLVPFARTRAQTRYGRPFSGHDTIVIGDTPNDIACGRAAGARTIAVASGPFSVDELRAHHPDAALPGLLDVEALVQAVFG